MTVLSVLSCVVAFVIAALARRKFESFWAKAALFIAAILVSRIFLLFVGAVLVVLFPDTFVERELSKAVVYETGWAILAAVAGFMWAYKEEAEPAGSTAGTASDDSSRVIRKPPRPPRNIILLSDGTGNSAGRLFKTNVWRVYQALDTSNIDQAAHYDDGVGASRFRPLAMIGGIFGWGLKRNLIGLYVFLCANYMPGDRIYGFGFSRGAFTIRVLAKFVLAKGLIQNYTSDDDLGRKAVRLYREFRKDRHTWFRLEVIARGIRDIGVAIWDWLYRPYDTRRIETRPVEAIEFLGLWDTVDAYGLPVAELKHGIDRYVWPLGLDDAILDQRIEKACHALSIDDQRLTFHPLLWDETDSTRHPERASTDEEALTQVWFTGVHANIGGGYPDDGLSYVSLKWMIGEARAKGLKFYDSALVDIARNASPYGRIYNSRSSFGAYYRYDPRYLDPPCDRQGAIIPHPKIHESVILRLALGNDGYAPLNLPGDFRIVRDLPFEQHDGGGSAEIARGGDAARPNIHLFEEYLAARTGRNEIAGEPQKPISNGLDHRQVDLSGLDRPSRDDIELVWDTVWWRKLIYLALVCATLVVVIFPWLSDSRIRLGDFGRFDGIIQLADAPAALIAGAMSSLLPVVAKPWIDALRLHPFSTSFWISMVVLLLWWGRIIDRRIRDRAQAAWNAATRASRYNWFRASVKARIVWTVVAMTFFGFITFQCVRAALDTTVTERFLNSTVRDAPCKIEPCETVSDEEKERQREFWRALADQQSRVGRAGNWMLAFFFGATTWLWTHYLIGIWRLAKRARGRRHELPGRALRMARWLRNSRFVGFTWRQLTAGLVPLLFALLVVMSTALGLSRLSFAFMEAGGWICPEIFPLKKVEGDVDFTFDLKEGCGASRYQLIGGTTYRVSLIRADKWSDGPRNLRRMPDIPFEWIATAEEWSMWRYHLKLPLRRVLAQDWFTPIARVGATGSQEYPLGVEPQLIKPTLEGELFVYVNDAVLGLPKAWNLFYRDNGGTLKVGISIVPEKSESRKPISSPAREEADPAREETPDEAESVKPD